VGSPLPEREALLRQARAAHRDHRYDAAYAALRSAADEAPLDVSDVHLLADAAWWLGLMTEALRLTESAHRAFLDAGHVDRAAAHALDLAGMLGMRGEPALASAWLGRARALLDGQPPGPAHGTLWYADLSLALGEERLDEADALAEDLQRLGEQHDDQNCVALGLLGAGLVALQRARVDTAYGLLEEAMLRVLGGGVAPEWAGHIHCTVVAACLDVADLNRARQWSEAAYRWLADFPDAVMFTGVCRAHNLALLVTEGAWAAADEEAAKVVEELRELNVEAVAEAEYQRGECHRLRGDTATAAECFARAADSGRDPEPGRALLLLADGDREAAWEAIRDAVVRERADPFRRVPLLRAEVEVALATGRGDAARSAARRLDAVAGAFGTAGLRAWADLADGTVALAEARFVEAETALARAAAAFHRLHCWYDAAVAEHRLAEAHSRMNQPALADEHRQTARGLFRRLGVPDPYEGSPRLSAAPGNLTPREAEVLGLVATGLGNRDAALRLSISEATVRRHLANIYAKLGVSSRTAAAAWAHRNGLVPRT